MKKIDDEILNKYIDGELSPEETVELKTEIEKDPEVLSRLKALKLVDSSLKEIPVSKAPFGIKEKVMNMIYSTSQIKSQKSYFFISVISVFVVSIIGAIVYAISAAAPSNEKLNINTSFLDKVKNYFTTNFGSIDSLFKSSDILLIGGALTVILIISAYFMVDSHKSFMKKMNTHGH